MPRFGNCIAALSFALVSASAQVQAQGTCPGTTPAPDNCLIGNWIGTNSMLDRMQDLIASMPSSVAENVPVPTLPASLGITIQADGWYSTLPLHQSVAYESIIDDTSHLVELDLSVATHTGRIWTEGSQMLFCTDPSSGNLHVEATGTDGTRTADVPLIDGPPPWFAPDINYSCSGTNLSFTVFLPDPIGDIQYWLSRVPADRFAEEFRRTLPGE
ncbi:hypothetical protein [uncultured Litoreibacter sp.]|uniref:hypothetical protein n=2 Tax=uncultured Litoreibacter sp. TaxID=1392394 RepID=UPI00263A0D61|nr:hypothetical protein [uncultured Litoreibacter sp.]